MVNIDTVYQRVLALANKEQRGYITPQDFNLFANQAQMEIFEQYFYDEEQFERDPRSDIVELLDQKTQIFKQAPIPVDHEDVLPLNTYQIDDVWVRHASGKRSVVQRVSRKEVQGIQSSPLLNTALAQCYYIYNNTIYFIWTGSSLDWRINLIRKPVTPNWTYFIDTSSQSALYNSSAVDLQDFELHISEENNLVIKILLLAGISMKDMGLAQLAGQKEASVKQQEKQ